MRHLFREKTVLVVNDNEHSRKMLVAVMRVIGFRNIEQAKKAGEGFAKFQRENIDVIIGDITDGTSDAIALCEMVRNKEDSPNRNVPLLAVAGSNALHLVDRAKEVLITDLLQSPYSVNNIANKIKYVLNLEQEQLENIRDTYTNVAIENKSEAPQSAEEDVIDAQIVEEWPDEDETHTLTDTLLDHYLKHYEVVFSKLKIAQEATHKCMEEVREVYEKAKERDNTNVMQFKDFDKMWEDVLALFMKGGMSEEDIFEIEKLITVIPKDIREHYDEISQQDKSFLALIESLNTAAYKKAKEKVVKLQAQPNPLNGRTSEDYDLEFEDDDEDDVKAFIFKPRSRT